MSNQVFTVNYKEFQIYVEGKVLPTIWNSHGAAQAGLAVELRRRMKNRMRVTRFQRYYVKGY